jgi:sugar phosphate permease
VLGDGCKSCVTKLEICIVDPYSSFIIEGCISLVIGFVILLTLPRDQAKAWFLNAEEKALMSARVQRDAAANKEGDKLSWKYVRMAISDPVIWIASIALFCSTTPLFGFGTFLPTIIVGLG